MAEKASGSHHEAAFRAIEAEFAARPDHQPIEIAPPLIAMPTEIEFAQMTAQREAREQAEKAQREKAHKEWRERERRETWKGRMKKVMAATAIVMTFKSGGLMDMVGDEFSDAGQVAADAVSEPQTEDYAVSRPGDTLDGIPYEEFSQEVRDEWAAEAEAKVEAVEKARQTVIDLFERVDDEGYDGLVAEVSEYKATHPEIFIDKASVEAAHEKIDSAGTNEEIIEALDDFMDFYGSEVAFHGESFDDKQGSVNEIANAFVDVYSALPKDFIELAKVSKITISDEAVVEADGTVGHELGRYSTSGEINIVASSKLFNAMMSVEGFLQRTDMSYQGVIAHELGHALNEQLGVGATLPEDEKIDLEVTGDEKTPVVPFIEHIGRGIINRPEAPSVYAKSEQEEFNAEILSGVLSDRSGGLATTDEWRKFGSESNKAMIASLVDLEQAYPGIAKILIANRVS